MVEHGIDVGWEHALVVVVHLYGGVGPPKEGLGHVGAVVEHALDFEVGAAGTQGEAGHAFLVEHFLHLAHPYGHRTVGIVGNGGVDGHEGRWTVMLGPVELDATADPRTGEAHQCGFHHVVVIHEMTFLDFVVGHLHPTAQLGQYHHLDVFVLEPDGQVIFVFLRVADRLYHGVGIHHARRSLVDALLQKNGIFLCLPNGIGWYAHQLPPSFYHDFDLRFEI